MSEFRRRQMMAAASGKRQIVWNQLVVNGNFAEGGDNPTGWVHHYQCVLDNSNSDYIVVKGKTYMYQLPQNPFTVGHVYYIKAKGRYESSNTEGYMYFYWQSANVRKFNLDGSWTEWTIYGTARADATYSTVGLCRMFIGNGECVLQIDKNYGINIFDLTMMFGEGNEPTQAEFEAMFNLPNTYYPYNAGEVMYI